MVTYMSEGEDPKLWSPIYMEIYSRLPHWHTVTGRPGAPDSGTNYQKKE
jgi:hypothetical protein